MMLHSTVKMCMIKVREDGYDYFKCKRLQCNNVKFTALLSGDHGAQMIRQKMCMMTRPR